jgi:uncharacterized protein
LGKLLLLLFIALVFWWLLKGLLKTRNAPPPPAQSGRGEDMVACARCGVNLPRSDAREEGGRYYCTNNPGCQP